MVRRALGIVTLLAVLGAAPAASARTLYVSKAASGCSDARAGAVLDGGGAARP